MINHTNSAAKVILVSLVQFSYTSHLFLSTSSTIQIYIAIYISLSIFLLLLPTLSLTSSASTPSMLSRILTHPHVPSIPSFINAIYSETRTKSSLPCLKTSTTRSQSRNHRFQNLQIPYLKYRNAKHIFTLLKPHLSSENLLHIDSISDWNNTPMSPWSFLAYTQLKFLFTFKPHRFHCKTPACVT